MIRAIAPSRLVGILGGMGPAATADFYTKLIELTPASTDQEHLRVMIWADPTVPSRQEALLSDGADPTPWLRAGADQLQRCGTDIIVVPCNTVHGYLPAVMEGRDVEFISIIDTTIAALPTTDAQEPIGLLATNGALASSIYQDALTAAGHQVALPSWDQQQTLMRLVHEVKAGLAGSALRTDLAAVTDSLRNQGARAVIAGCTELSTLLDAQADTNGLQVIDPAIELARRTVVRARAGNHSAKTED